MDILKGIIAFILLILFIVSVHEGGHLIAAKIFGVYCSEFSIGMGPQLYRKKNKETDFVIRLIPIGGFCSMAGETEDGLEKRHEVDVPKERTIKGISRWKQIIVYLAGVTMNFITGFIIIVLALMTITLVSPKVASIEKGSIAENYFVVGDVLVSKDSSPINRISDISENGLTGTYIVNRDGQEIILEVKEENIEKLGLHFEEQKVPFSYALESAPEIFKEYAVAIIDGIKTLVHKPTQISGVVGIANMTTEAVSDGLTVYLMLIALISINIGIFNLIPLPVMDGGRVLIAIVEMIIGHEINKEFEKKIMLICAALLILLMLWAFGLDIARYVFKLSI